MNQETQQMAKFLLSQHGIKNGQIVPLATIQRLFRDLSLLLGYYQLEQIPWYEYDANSEWASREARKAKNIAAGKAHMDLFAEANKIAIEKQIAEGIPTADLHSSELAKALYLWTVMHSMSVRKTLTIMETTLGIPAYNGLNTTLPIRASYYNMAMGGMDCSLNVHVNFVRTVWSGHDDVEKRLVLAHIVEDKTASREPAGTLQAEFDIVSALEWTVQSLKVG